MMKRYLFCIAFGMAVPLGCAVHAGPDALISVGVRWQAAQREYVFYAEPAREMDESMVASVLAVAPKPAPKRVVKR